MTTHFLNSFCSTRKLQGKRQPIREQVLLSSLVCFTVNSMNTCDTCRYWDYDRHCLNPKVGGMLEDDSDTIRTEQEDVPFITGPKFGCVHWEER